MVYRQSHLGHLLNGVGIGRPSEDTVVGMHVGRVEVERPDGENPAAHRNGGIRDRGMTGPAVGVFRIRPYGIDYSHWLPFCCTGKGSVRESGAVERVSESPRVIVALWSLRTGRNHHRIALSSAFESLIVE